MIPVSPANVQTEPWKKELQQASLSLTALLEQLDLQPNAFTAPLLASPHFKIKATASYINKIIPKNPNDPLLLQILPFAKEAKLTTGFSADPVGDLTASLAPGLIQKYHGRALLLTSSVCPMHCRYCFRKYFPYQAHLHLNSAIEQLKADRSIHEIILSGGDPLSLDNKNLAQLFVKLEAIPHLQTLRIHSRFPIALPSRLDKGLLDLFAQSRFHIVLVSHCNHAQEIGDTVIAALQPFNTVATLLNQSVLLQNINDHVSTLVSLSQQLFAAGILPYYLHQLDKAQGTAHFAVTNKHATQLLSAMQAQLPGYLVPRLVYEKAGAPNKIWLPMVDK